MASLRLATFKTNGRVSYGAVTNGGVQINTFSAGSSAINWTTIVGSGLTMTTEALGIAGHIETLSIGGVLTGKTDFAFARPQTDLLTGSLSNLELSAGTALFGATVTGSSIKVALLSQGTNRFLGIEANGLTISATLPGFTGAITNGGVRVNRRTILSLRIGQCSRRRARYHAIHSARSARISGGNEPW